MQRIRTRLIAAFMLVSILPAIPLFFVVRDLFERSFEPRAGERMQEALAAGIEESRGALRAEKESFREEVRSRWVARSPGSPIEEAGVFDGREEGLVVRALDHPRLVDRARKADDPEAPVSAWAEAAETPLVVEGGANLPEPERVSGCLALVLRDPEAGRILFARRLPPEMEERAEKLSGAMALVEGLRAERSAAVRSYVLPFVLVYVLFLCIAAGVGAVLAGRLARPIETLVTGAKRVASGDLDARVPLTGRGETRTLQEAFNEMVERLSSQRKDLARLERKAAWRDLARTLAHEIKNPLTPIQLAVEEMRDRYKGGDPEYERLVREASGIVAEEVDSLRALVREFSEFARLPEPNLRTGDLADPLREIEKLYGSEKVIVEAPEGGVAARFDAAEIRRALLNLADNALAAVAAAGKEEKVLLRLRRAGETAVIEVIDEGPGITPENLARVFEPDFTTKRSGMGLGLAIVEGIVAAHRGTIAVRSEPRRGTTFEIVLPAGEPEEKA